MDSNLKPIEGNLDRVVIENPSGSRMRQWNDVKLENGNIFRINPKRIQNPFKHLRRAFCEIVHGFQPLTIFGKSFILDV